MKLSRESTSWSRLKTFLSKFKLTNGSGNNNGRGILLDYKERPNRLCRYLRVLDISYIKVTTAGIIMSLSHLPRLESFGELGELAFKHARSPNITLDSPLHRPEALSTFPHLMSLMLDSIPTEKSWLANLYDYFMTNGEQIKQLCLGLVPDRNRSIQVFDVRKIFINCPYLRRLTTDEANIEWSNGPNPPQPLRFLKQV